MRPRVYWMTSLDESILEFFYDLSGDPPVGLPPKPVWWNVVEQRRASDKSHTTVARRMKKLTEAGLLERVDEDKGYYALSQLGVDYLENDLTEEQRDQLQAVFEE